MRFYTFTWKTAIKTEKENVAVIIIVVVNTL